MRQLTIFIDARNNVPTDNVFSFSSADSLDAVTASSVIRPLNQIYRLVNLVLNYSVISSAVTSTIVMGVGAPFTPDIALRSGQPITITDNGDTVFEGVILTAKYTLLPMTKDSEGGLYLIATIAPSIYQLTISPMIFDAAQAQQISTCTKVNVQALLAAGVTQSIATTDLLSYVITNMDYSNYFKKTISASNLGTDLYLMTSIGDSRDLAIRSSIDYYNCVFYQQENGTIVIRQLDPSIEAPFDLDVTNGNLHGSEGGFIPVAALLDYEYLDDAYSTPAMVSNYAIVDPNDVVSGSASNVVQTYAPNPEFFPRIGQLQASGWFVGQVGNTQVNNNIINNPTTATALKQFQALRDQYMVSVQASGVKNQFIVAYQALLTAKQMGLALTGYAGLMGTVSLDDPNLIEADLSQVVGTCLQIQNCDLKAGLIATCSRSYSAQGSFLSFHIVPLGSYTGWWLNSNFTPNFGDD